MIKDSIVLVPFPFDDLSSYKVRPALCLTSEIGDFEQVVTAFISSRIPPKLYPSDMVLRPDGPGWEKSGLITDSVVRLHKIVTIQKNMIRRRIGRLDEDSSAVVRMKLNTVFN